MSCSRRGAAQGRDSESLAATVQSVAEDLEIKLEHCTRSGGRLGGAVTVRVRTLQGSAESKSWQVFYMPKVLEAAENASPDLFPQLSSPTEEALVPGRYVMWVRDPATATARRADRRQGWRREEGTAPGAACPVARSDRPCRDDRGLAPAGRGATEQSGCGLAQLRAGRCSTRAESHSGVVRSAPSGADRRGQASAAMPNRDGRRPRSRHWRPPPSWRSRCCPSSCAVARGVGRSG